MKGSGRERRIGKAGCGGGEMGEEPWVPITSDAATSELPFKSLDLETSFIGCGELSDRGLYGGLDSCMDSFAGLGIAAGLEERWSCMRTLIASKVAMRMT